MIFMDRRGWWTEKDVNLVEMFLCPLMHRSYFFGFLWKKNAALLSLFSSSSSFSFLFLFLFFVFWRVVECRRNLTFDRRSALVIRYSVWSTVFQSDSWETKHKVKIPVCRHVWSKLRVCLIGDKSAKKKGEGWRQGGIKIIAPTEFSFF